VTEAAGAEGAATLRPPVCRAYSSAVKRPTKNATNAKLTSMMTRVITAPNVNMSADPIRVLGALRGVCEARLLSLYGT
jgi:hypothetical protein